MEDPNLIFTLKPIGDRANHAFALEHNRSRYVQANLEEIAPNRGKTPATDGGESDGEDGGRLEEDLGSKLSFTFNQKPKDIKRGFLFGGSTSRCDVVLGRPEHGISAQAFRITFDDLGRLFLEAKSTVDMAVNYNGEHLDQKRRNFKWILIPKRDFQVKIEGINRRGRPKLPELEFSIHIASHDSCKTEFEGLMRSYIEEARTATDDYQKGSGTLDINYLDMSSFPSTAAGSEPLPQQKIQEENRIFVKQERIGSGLSGIVHKGLDVSTGDTYAIKDLRVDDRSLDWRREVEIMKRVSHVILPLFSEV